MSPPQGTDNPTIRVVYRVRRHLAEKRPAVIPEHWPRRTGVHAFASYHADLMRRDEACPAMAHEPPVPYETLVRFGVIQERLFRIWLSFGKLDDRLEALISEQLGLTENGYYNDAVRAEYDAAVKAKHETQLTT